MLLVELSVIALSALAFYVFDVYARACESI